MKKNLIIVLALGLGFNGTLKAQDATISKVKFGIKAGANLTTLGTLKSGDEEFDYNYKPGFTFGVFSEIPIDGKLAIIPEINYSQKGADVEGTIAGNTGKLEQRLQYIDVPIALSFKATPKFSVFVGPQVSFFLSQKSKTYVNGEKVDESTSSEDVAKTIAGGLVGLAYDLTPNFNINGRYMRDFQKGSSNDDPAFEDIRNSGFALTLGYKF